MSQATVLQFIQGAMRYCHCHQLGKVAKDTITQVTVVTIHHVCSKSCVQFGLSVCSVG